MCFFVPSGGATLQNLSITGCINATTVVIPAGKISSLDLVNVEFCRVHFENNSAVGAGCTEGILDSTSCGTGRGIRADRKIRVAVSDSTFYDNTAEQGGAIYAARDLKFRIRRWRSTFNLSEGAIHSNRRPCLLDPRESLPFESIGPSNLLRVEVQWIWRWRHSLG